MAYEEHVDPPDDFDGDSEEIDAEEREALQQDPHRCQHTLKVGFLPSRGIKGVRRLLPGLRGRPTSSVWEPALPTTSARSWSPASPPVARARLGSPTPDEYVHLGLCPRLPRRLRGLSRRTATGEDFLCLVVANRLPEGGLRPGPNCPHLRTATWVRSNLTPRAPPPGLGPTPRIGELLETVGLRAGPCSSPTRKPDAETGRQRTRSDDPKAADGKRGARATTPMAATPAGGRHNRGAPRGRKRGHTRAIRPKGHPPKGRIRD